MAQSPFWKFVTAVMAYRERSKFRIGDKSFFRPPGSLIRLFKHPTTIAKEGQIQIGDTTPNKAMMPRLSLMASMRVGGQAGYIPSKIWNISQFGSAIPSRLIMRALTEEETNTLFTKLAKYTGPSLKTLIAPAENAKENQRMVFRVHQSRVYYVSLSLANLATR